MNVEFRYARCDEYPRISGFIDQYWAKDHVYVRTPALFEWTFRRPGFWDANEYSFALAEDGGELIGILGGIPYTFNAFGNTRRGMWIVNYAIRPDHRKGAAALRLLSMFRNPSFPVVIASGLTRTTVVIYRVLRGQVLPATPRHVVVLPGAAERMTRLISLANPEWNGSRAAALAAAFELPALPEPQAEYGATLPPDWDRLNWSALALTTAGAVRDSDYLTWRYLKHPCFEYRILTLGEGERTGLLIWRLETVRLDTAGGRIEIDRIGRIVEFLPASRENGRLLVAGLQRQLADAGALGGDFYGYHGCTRSVLSENGVLSAAVHPDGTALPARFQPIAPGSEILNAMFADPGLPDCTIAGDCPWYWTKSDSDQDRPN
jgi:hypothetical protein